MRVLQSRNLVGRRPEWPELKSLKRDAAVMGADTLMITIPSQLGPDVNLRILENFAEHVAPELGWVPNREGPATGYEPSDVPDAA